MKSTLLVMTAALTILNSVTANADMYNTDYQSTSPASSYNWAPFKSYGLGTVQQTDSFRDLTWFTHGTLTAPRFTTVNGVTLKGNANISTGDYIKWGMTGGGTMPPMALLGAIQSGTVTPALLAANPVTPKAIGDPRDYSVSTTNVMEGLQTIVLQLRTSTIFPAGIYYTPFELGQMSAPVVLSLNGGAILLNWDYRNLDHVSYDQFSTGYTQEVWSFQWDLSNVGVAITDFSVNFEMFPYGNLTGLQIDQGNSGAQAVPEPSTYAFLAFGVGLLFGTPVASALPALKDNSSEEKDDKSTIAKDSCRRCDVYHGREPHCRGDARRRGPRSLIVSILEQARQRGSATVYQGPDTMEGRHSSPIR